MSRNFLKEVVQKKREQLAVLKTALPEEQLKEKIAGLPPAKGFKSAISKPKKLNLIAEIKRASPSCGDIRTEVNVAAVAGIYKEAGAAAVSVLTEEYFFRGSVNDLSAARAAVDIPILRKDFIVDPYQIYETRAFGADAVLLIADLLINDTLTALMRLSEEIGLDYIVEVHNEKELKRALKLKPAVIGINNRDLATLKVDFKTTERLLPLIPKDKITVVESGLKSHQDVMFVRILGVSAVLIGEAFMRATDIGETVRDFMGY